MIAFPPPEPRISWNGLCVWLSARRLEVLTEWRLRLAAAGAVVIAPCEPAIAAADGPAMAARIDAPRRLAADMADVLLVLDGAAEPGAEPIDAEMTADIAAAQASRDVAVMYLSQQVNGGAGAALTRIAVDPGGGPLLALPLGLDASDVQALSAVAVEAARQRLVKGCTPRLDDTYPAGELAAAAGCYLLSVIAEPPGGRPPHLWPWRTEHFKPRGPWFDAVRGTALGLAELSRLIRVGAAEIRRCE